MGRPFLPVAPPGAPPWGWSLRLIGVAMLAGAMVGRLRLLPSGYPDDDPDGEEPLVWADGTTNCLELADLIDTGDETEISGATVTATFADADRTARPDIGSLALEPVSGKPGTYRWLGTLSLELGARYRLRVEATLGTHRLVIARWVVVHSYRGEA